MLLKFINRVDELNNLNERYNSSQSEFIIIYGRRRIGKTELIKQFAKDKNHFYFLARKEPIPMEINRFREKFSKKFNIYLEETKDFESLFKNIVENKNFSEKFVFIIDEFPYLIESYKPIVSVFQGVWDEVLKNENILLNEEKMLLNINIPDIVEDKIKGVEITKLGTGQYEDHFEKRVDPMGNDYYWMAGKNKDIYIEGTDVRAVADKKISITPLSLNLTDFTQKRKLNKFLIKN